VTQDLDTLLTALYVKIDDTIRTPRWLGRPPLLTDSELVCLAVAQVLLGARSEAHWIRYARIHLRPCSRTCHNAPATTNGSVPPCR
jgi:hypothetical protein